MSNFWDFVQVFVIAAAAALCVHLILDRFPQMIAVLLAVIAWRQYREIQRLRHVNEYLRQTLRQTQHTLLVKGLAS